MAHSALHTPIEMTGATKNCKIEKKNDAFVDNTDGYAKVKKWDGESEKEAVSSLQQKAQLWARLIAVLGGATAFHKCIWQVIGWNYTHFPPKLKTKSEYNIKLTNRAGVQTKIQQLPIDQPNVGLGCRLNPDGNQSHESTFCLDQCKRIHGKLSATSLTMEETYQYLLTSVFPEVS